MRRAALYVRVSTDLQEREQTIESQLAAVTRHAEQQGLRTTPALTYTDDGYSGTWLDRPALDELRDHAREGRFDVVVVLCPDRLARRYAYQVLLVEELKRAGIEVLFCERPINDSPDDQLLLQIQGAIAEYERAKILDRCRRGRLHRARRGELAPPNPPYGYAYAARKYGGDGQIRINEEEAAVVRQVFEWYVAEGATLHGVTLKLNASCAPTRRGRRRWHPTRVLTILRQEWYVGCAYDNRVAHRLQERARAAGGESRAAKIVRVRRPRSEWIRVAVPRIIDDALFARAQQRIEENRRFARRRLRREGVYLLKGLLKCGVCGHAYTGMTQIQAPVKHGLPEQRYYKCNGRTRVLESVMPAPCTSRQLHVAGADAAVWTAVRDLLLDSDAVARELQAWLTRTSADATREDRQRRAETRASELQRQRERLIDAYQGGVIELKDFSKRKEAVEQAILDVQQELTQLRSWAARQELAQRQVLSAETILERLRGLLAEPSFETKQAILRLLVEKVVVTERRFEIHLAVPVSGLFDLTSGWGAKPLVFETRRGELTRAVFSRALIAPNRDTARLTSGSQPPSHGRAPGTQLWCWRVQDADATSSAKAAENPSRCERTTMSGWTTSRASFHRCAGPAELGARV